MRWFLTDQAITDKKDDAFAHDDVAAFGNAADFEGASV